MAESKRGRSPHTRRRRALQRVAELEAKYTKIERSRPRTRGKKGAKTRALNTLRRQLGSARGQLRKALNAIAQVARGRAAAKAAVRQEHREAARKGWITRKVRAPKPAPRGSSGLFMPHLTTRGVVWINPTGSDRSAEGRWWASVAGPVLENRPSQIDRFENQSVYDTETGHSLPFVTDPNVILEFEHELDFGPSFYKRRDEVPRFASEP